MKRYLPFLFSLVVIGAGCAPGPFASNGREPGLSNVPRGETELDLSGRGLTAIPSTVFFRTDLVKLDVSMNRLTGAPPTQIGQLKNLTFLDLSGNALTGLPAEIGRLNKLEVLDVSNNLLTGLPLELGKLSGLRVLDVSGNPYSAQDLDAITLRLPKTKIIQ